MSATTPAARGGLGSQRFGTALVAVALAIAVIIALVGLRAFAGRTTTVAPDVAPAPAPASLYDRGWATDGGKLSSPMFSVAGDHSSAIEGSSVAAPVAAPAVGPYGKMGTAPEPQAPAGGGRGTRIAQ